MSEWDFNSGRKPHLQVSKVGLLVERCALETERVHDVVDSYSTILKRVTTLFRGRVGTLRQRSVNRLKLHNTEDAPMSTFPSSTTIIFASTS